MNFLAHLAILLGVIGLLHWALSCLPTGRPFQDRLIRVIFYAVSIAAIIVFLIVTL